MNDDPEVILVHSSDLHIGSNHHREDLTELNCVLEAARQERADVLLLAGDVFEHNRLPTALVDRVAQTMIAAGLPIVILPGNHDCLTANSVYARFDLAKAANVSIIGVSAPLAVAFAAWDLEIWGRPHVSYGDFAPLHPPHPRTTRYQVAVAHGHWVPGPYDSNHSWRIYDEDIGVTGADYVALGHWEQFQAAGDGGVPAYYSGSPDRAGTVNVVRFHRDGQVEVGRAALGEGGRSLAGTSDRALLRP